MLVGHFGAKKIYSLPFKMCGGLTCLGYEIMLVPELFAKSKIAVHRLPLSCCRPPQNFLGGSNPGAWILLPPYYCILALIPPLYALIALLNIFA